MSTNDSAARRDATASEVEARKIARDFCHDTLLGRPRDEQVAILAIAITDALTQRDAEVERLTKERDADRKWRDTAHDELRALEAALAQANGTAVSLSREYADALAKAEERIKSLVTEVEPLVLKCEEYVAPPGDPMMVPTWMKTAAEKARAALASGQEAASDQQEGR